ncbi:response regulator [Stutzerimonas nosocomialis]|uniref:Response regulator n=1 Tax=Stutzerimonas nosocomialis TaxID=1056496 RepID=A0A5R9QEU1_9GAMM|nr:response regulator [Stutzerimonas nosocomialis]TLX59669.1 response regulator [Stutzerimonas nosocomialis]TLX63490.1 response regulator [Stutzerimonas nosocomialis]
MNALHVLVVDDEVEIAGLFQAFLELDGYRVSMAYGGEAALRLDEADPVDVLVTDLAMPGMDGRELVERLRQRRPELPVLVVSGYPSDAFVGVARTRVLNKPVGLAPLTRCLRELLESC